MTVSAVPLAAWASRPFGKVARIVMAGAGMLMAISVLMTAAVVAQGAWALVILGVALAAAAVRAAHWPTMGRLVALGAVMVAIPVSMLLF